jgi:hypothetical protein
MDLQEKIHTEPERALWNRWTADYRALGLTLHVIDGARPLYDSAVARPRRRTHSLAPHHGGGASHERAGLNRHNTDSHRMTTCTLFAEDFEHVLDGSKTVLVLFDAPSVEEGAKIDLESVDEPIRKRVVIAGDVTRFDLMHDLVWYLTDHGRPKPCPCYKGDWADISEAKQQQRLREAGVDRRLLELLKRATVSYRELMEEARSRECTAVAFVAIQRIASRRA